MDIINLNNDVFSATDIGLVRKANEDNCFVAETPNGFLFVVCDGMGGHVGGANASKIAVNSIVTFFIQKKYNIIQQALTDALIFANTQILGVATEKPELKGMGTTACILLIQNDKVWYAHIGDSRIYLFCHKEQRLHRLTKDHSFVQGLVEQNIISEKEAEHHPDKNRLLKTLGVQKNVEPEIGTIPALPTNNDIFLICSDGLTGMVSDDVLEHILSQKILLYQKGADMLTLAKQAGGEDNITIQLINISNSPHENSIFESKNSSNQVRTNTLKRNRRYINLYIFIPLIMLLSLTVFFIVSTHFSKKEDKESIKTHQQENPIVEKKEWKKKVENMNKLEIKNKEKTCFQKNKDGNIINGIIVYNNDSYFIGTFYYNTYGEIKGEVFNKDGTFKESYPKSKN